MICDDLYYIIFIVVKTGTRLLSYTLFNCIKIFFLFSVRYITAFGSSLAAPGELPYSVNLFDRATKNGSSGH